MISIHDTEYESSCVLTIQPFLRQSFDRFNDNLLENILSYLTFNQKVLFESVSKRWKKFVYKQQKELELRRDLEDIQSRNSLIKILEPIKVADYSSATAAANSLKGINKIWLKSLMKKCKSFEKVVLECYLDVEDLDIIFENSSNLKSIEFETCGLSADDLDYLGSKYGHRLERVQFYGLSFTAKYLNRFLIYCKNLKEFKSMDFYELFRQDINYLPKLERCNYQLRFEEGKSELQLLDKFEAFCTKFCETLTTLNIGISDNKSVEGIESFIKSIIKLKCLRNLVCSCSNIQDPDKVILGLSNVPIKKLHLALFPRRLRIDKIFAAFERFNNLEKLDIYLRGWNEEPSLSGTVKYLKSSKNLKHLKIGAGHISEDFFEDISKHLPNLTTLILRTESEVTDKTIFELSHLKKLKTFYFNKHNNFNQFITDESVGALINGCPALEVLRFGSMPNITNKIIKALIYIANTYPKREIQFLCGQSNVEGEQHIQTIHMYEFVAQMPINLNILFS